MQIRYLRATWGMTQPTLGDRLRTIRDDGFDGVETSIPVDPGERRELGRLLDELGLLLVAQQWTQGRTPREHIESFEEQYRRAAPLGPFLVNSHTGSDHLALAGNLEIFRGAASLEAELGVPVVHEVHRGRATFSTGSTMDLLDNLPGLKLAADFSHWCCVHESLLEDQDDRLERAIGRSFHIHARVGHAEGPQVSDPRAPEWSQALEAHLGWWQRIIDRRAAEGVRELTICPEFGPPDYMPTLPWTRQPVADLGDVNTAMRDILRRRLHP